MQEIPDLSDPFDLFARWFSEAREQLGDEIATSLTLATASRDGMPSARVVLLKDAAPEGFTFYTNLGSNKARELEVNPRASMCFHWAPFGRQVRIQGGATRVTEREADAYFSTRPRDSQLGAWASRQSEPLDSRHALLERVASLAEQFGPDEIPRPSFWSGFRIEPSRYEFWLKGDYRLHDRRVYFRGTSGGWDRMRLYP